MALNLPVLLLIVPGQVYDQGDICGALEQLFQDRGIEDDVPIEDHAAALHLVLGAEERKEFSRLFIPIVVVVADVGQCDRVLLVAAH
ncbi:MAG: hypothetical protein C4294_11270 [Nitrospiraceae bacterium]